MIPRRFFWLFDSLLLALGFVLAYGAAPHIQSLFTLQGALAFSLIERILIPPQVAQAFPPSVEYLWMLPAMIPSTILFLELFNAYSHRRRSFARTVFPAAIGPFLSLSLVALGLIAVKETSWSRLMLFLYTAFSSALLTAFRIFLWIWSRKHLNTGFYTRNVVLIGSATGIEQLAERFLRKAACTEYHLYGYLSMHATDSIPLVQNIPRLGTVDQLGTLAVHRPIHEVVVSIADSDGGSLQQVIKDCDYFRIALRIVPEVLLTKPPEDLQMANTNYGMPFPALVLRPHEFDSDVLFVKRLIDIVLSATALVMLSPVYLIIAILIKLTTPRLPVFYPWRVVGQNGVEFTGYKFTTMVADAEAQKSTLQKYNEMTGPVFKIKNDPRITPLGKFLRKYSLNELPQLWSVLKGDMSLVGPRPAGPHELVRYEFWHKRKLSVQSGITCLWQVSGRNKISNFDDWVRMDLEYIDNQSLWLDIRILLKTVWVVIHGSGS